MAGEVGYVITGLKDVSALRVGDTLTTRKGAAATEPLPGYKDVKPMVFAGLFPSDSDEYPELRDALERLKLNDAALFYEPETSRALGFGFRCGFLGLLHMEIVRERLEREFDLDLIVTAPNVAYRVLERNGEWREVHNPSEMPAELEEVEEPYIHASIIVPKEYVGTVMELNNERRGTFDQLEYLSPERVHLTYDLPLAEIVLDYYDQLKSRTRGYASFDYDLSGFQPGKLVRVDVLVGGEPVDALSLIIHREFAYDRGRLLVEKLREEIPRQMFDVPDPGCDRVARDRARDRQGAPQGRAREVLRRRHLPQAQAAREAEEGQEADEAGRRGGGAAGGVPGGAQPRRGQEEVALGGSARSRSRAPTAPTSAISTCTCRSARTAAATATSSPSSAATSSTAPTSTRCSSSSSVSEACSRAIRRDRLRRRWHAVVHRSRRAAAACSRRFRRRPRSRVEANPETVTPELAALLARGRCDAGLARGPDIRPAAARGARARCRTGRRPARVPYSS